MQICSDAIQQCWWCFYVCPVKWKSFFLLASSARAKWRGISNLHNKSWVQTIFECYLMLCERGRWFLFLPPDPWVQSEKNEKEQASVYPGKGRFLFIFLWTLSIGYNNFFIIPSLFLTHNPIFDYLWASRGHKELIIIKRTKRRFQSESEKDSLIMILNLFCKGDSLRFEKGDKIIFLRYFLS